MKFRITIVMAFILALWFQSLLCAPPITIAKASVAAPKYNVLFLIADDLRPELGVYGNRMIKTPNLDKLAGQGIRFGQVV